MVNSLGTLSNLYGYKDRLNAGSDSVKLKSLKQSLKNPTNEKLKKACSDFEAIFIKQMLDSMRKTVNKSGFLDGGMAEDIFEDMLYEKYAEKMSATANFGLKDILYRQLKGV